MKQKRKFVPIFLILLILSGCNLPDSSEIAARLNETAVAETAVSEMVLTMQAVTPSATVTPTPTSTPAPTFTLTPTFGPTPTPTLGPEYFHGSLWYEPEFVSQEGLTYWGKPIDTGCTAASVEMVLDFWHDYKEEYSTISAQTLLNQNAAQGQFNPNSGLNIMNTEDDLMEMRYYLGVREESDKEELLAALERYGPLLILTKVGWTPFGANHMAVISGYDPETDTIRILDPWTVGGITEFDYDNFDGIWSLNYGEETDPLRRTFFFIVPYAELDPVSSPFVPYYFLQSFQELTEMG